MAVSSKKITYTSDFKLKVLDYYFKHGGDEKFGLKKRTAGHFNIDKKTINRMLNNPEMVKKARKLLSRKANRSKVSASVRPVGAKSSPAKTTKTTSNKVTASGNTGKGGTVLSGSSSVSSSSSKIAAAKAPTSSTSSTKTTGASSQSSSSSSTTTTTTSQGISKNAAATSKPKFVGKPLEDKIEVFDLPEDPDYSLLKRSIDASVNGVANIAKLLVTGTEEVRNMVLNECDVILECKVCRNLFRSVVNFLAHKRIYCQEEYTDVKTLFHRDNVQGVTSHSSTAVVEPEPPPLHSAVQTKTSIPDASRSLLGSSKRKGIDFIAKNLARRRKGRDLSSSTHTGSSRYYDRIDNVNRNRNRVSRDCSVVLEDIGGVSNAMFQTYVSPNKTSGSVPISTIISEVSRHERGISVAINEHGEIVKTAKGDAVSMDVEKSTPTPEKTKEFVCRTCNTKFATQKTLSVHQRSQHSYLRSIYSCPICKTTFLSMWAVIKHLQRYHKKNKSQTERLRKVIKKKVIKKLVYHGEEDEYGDEDKLEDEKGEYSENEDDEEQEEEEEEEEIEEPDEVEVQPNPVDKGHKIATTSVPSKSSPIKAPLKTPTKRDDMSSISRSVDHCCIKCGRRFLENMSLLVHEKFCSLRQMMPDGNLEKSLRSQVPEKKIAIQIRKDYHKTVPVSSTVLSHCKEPAQEGPSDTVKSSCKGEMIWGEICDLSRRTCVPCHKRYQKLSSLKRHAARHFDWTRYSCKVCKHKSYDKYELTRHCVTDHGINEESADDLFKEEEILGSFRHNLSDEVENVDNKNVSFSNTSLKTPEKISESKSSESHNEELGNSEISKTDIVKRKEIDNVETDKVISEEKKKVDIVQKDEIGSGETTELDTDLVENNIVGTDTINDNNGSTKKTGQVHTVETSSEVHVVENSGKVLAVENSSEIHAVETSSKVPAAKNSSEVHAVENSSEIHAEKNSNEVHAVENSNTTDTFHFSTSTVAAENTEEDLANADDTLNSESVASSKCAVDDISDSDIHNFVGFAVNNDSYSHHKDIETVLKNAPLTLETDTENIDSTDSHVVDKEIDHNNVCHNGSLQNAVENGTGNIHDESESPNSPLRHYSLRVHKDSTTSNCSDEDKSERPQRTRRSIEQKDFIYSTKKLGSSYPESAEGKGNLTPKASPENTEVRSGSRRRHTISKCENVAKRPKLSHPQSENPQLNKLQKQDIQQSSLHKSRYSPLATSSPKSFKKNTSLLLTHNAGSPSKSNKNKPKGHIDLKHTKKSDEMVISRHKDNTEHQFHSSKMITTSKLLRMSQGNRSEKVNLHSTKKPFAKFHVESMKTSNQNHSSQSTIIKSPNQKSDLKAAGSSKTNINDREVVENGQHSNEPIVANGK